MGTGGSKKINKHKPQIIEFLNMCIASYSSQVGSVLFNKIIMTNGGRYKIVIDDQEFEIQINKEFKQNGH